VVLEKSHRKQEVSCLVSRIKRGDEVTGEKDKVKGSIDIGELAGWIFKVNMPLDIGIHYV
jgi:hypothetical protein